MGAIWQPDDPEPFPEIIRASGECVCEKCGQTYAKHPYDERFYEEVAWGTGKHYWVHVLCSGVLVKL